MENIILKVVSKIENSKDYYKLQQPSLGSYAPITIHCFDDFEIKQAHNGQNSFAVIFNGQTITRIESDLFYKTMENRKNLIKEKFLDS